MKKIIPILLLSALMCGVQAELPKSKQTTLGLYVTAAEAIKKYRQDKENVKILDVRTPAEYVFVGHPTMAVNIPVKYFEGLDETGKMKMTDNDSFVAEVKARFAETDVILITCRSGGRSAAAVNKLAEAGFVNAYSIIDGFEGDKLKMPGAPNDGKRVVNGWKNSGAPWTYKIDKDLIYQNCK